MSGRRDEGLAYKPGRRDICCRASPEISSECWLHAISLGKLLVTVMRQTKAVGRRRESTIDWQRRILDAALFVIAQK